MRERYRAIARVIKTHGRKGEVVTVPVHGLPLVLSVGMETFVVPPDLKGPRALTITSCVDSSTGQMISFDAIHDIEAADALVGKTLLIRASDLPEGFDLVDASHLMGREVADRTYGSLGQITQVLQGAAQNVWVVEGARGETLIPAVPEFVCSLGEEGPIEVDLPQGLIEWAGE